MSISDGHTHIADLRITGLNGIRGIGVNRLQFSMEIDVRATPGRAVEIGHLSALAYATTSQSTPTRPLGVPVPETSWHLTTTDHPRKEYLSLYLDLTGEQLEALERLRAGGHLLFQIDLTHTSDHERTRRTAWI